MADLSSRNTFFNQLKRLLTRVNNHENDPLTLELTHNLIKRAEDIQIKIENYHLSILADCVDDEAIAVQDAVFEEIMDVADKLAEKLINLRKILDTSQPRAQQQPQNHPIKLPELSLPSFDGKYEDWPPFEDLFRATIINHASLSGAQKLQYLKSCTTGEAHNLIRAFIVTDVNFTEAWNLLETRYKNNREIIYSLTRNILSIPLCKSENISSLQSLLNTATECIRSLKVLKRPTDKWDDLLVVILVDKLDPDTRSEWAKSLTGTEPATFEDLTSFLEKHIRSLIARGATVNTLTAPPPPHQHQHHSVKHVRSHHASISSSFSSKPSYCPVCKLQHHRLYHCTTFMAIQPAQRKASLRKTGGCFNCLSFKHKVSGCPSIHRCKKCAEPHHTLLHEESTAIPHTSTSNQSPPPKAVSSTIQSHHANTLTFPLATTLLKTALVFIRDSSGKRQPCRAFLDDGSEGSFITEACATALGLPHTRVDISVSGIGERETARCNWATTITLESAYSNSHINIHPYILKEVSGNMPATSIESATLAEWNHIHGLQLADPSYMKPGRVDILLGADIVARIITGKMRRGPAYTPTAINTIFGWTLFGSTGKRQTSHAKAIVTALHARVDKSRTTQPNQSNSRTNHAITRAAHNSAFSSSIGDETEDSTTSHHSPFNSTTHIADETFGPSRTQAENKQLAPDKFHNYPLHHQAYIEFVDKYLELGHTKPLPPTQIITHTFHIGTTLHSNSPAAPHQMGLWAACVKSFNHHMKQIVGACTLTIEQFITLLTNIEGCLNSRPLCSLFSDPKDMNALKPGHYLVGGPLYAVPHPSLMTIPANRLGRWQEVQQLSQHVWARWKAGYLTTLQQRQKQVRKQGNIAVDDLVFILEENSAPSMRKLDRVAEVLPGNYGLVHKARVRYVANPKQSPVRYAEIIRPMQKLIEGHPAKPPNLERDACLKAQTVPCEAPTRT